MTGPNTNPTLGSHFQLRLTQIGFFPIFDCQSIDFFVQKLIRNFHQWSEFQTLARSFFWPRLFFFIANTKMWRANFQNIRWNSKNKRVALVSNEPISTGDDPLRLQGSKQIPACHVWPFVTFWPFSIFGQKSASISTSQRLPPYRAQTGLFRKHTWILCEGKVVSSKKQSVD